MYATCSTAHIEGLGQTAFSDGSKDPLYIEIRTTDAAIRSLDKHTSKETDNLIRFSGSNPSEIDKKLMQI
jgi:hypothetical protein